MYFYIWVHCKQIYLKINCIQKYFVHISVASRGFYSVSLRERFSSVRTLAVRIESWLTLFISETLLQYFAVNNGLCMWSPALFEQIHAIFRNGVQYSIPASSGKTVEFCWRKSVFFKKLGVLLFWAGFSEDILRYLWIYILQKIILL